MAAVTCCAGLFALHLLPTRWNPAPTAVDEQQMLMAAQVVSNDWSVRQLEQAVKQQKNGTPASSSQADANIRHLEKRASDHFGAQVVVENSESKHSGWIKLKYQNYDVLSGILDKMGVEYE